MANINTNIIMQAGAAVANATNKAAGLSAATPEPGTVISAIQLVNGGRSIGPAALAHFTESVRNKLLSLQVDMDPIQDFNGFDHPWPAGGSVNQLPVTDWFAAGYEETIKGVKFTVNADGSITVKGTNTGSSAADFTLSSVTVLPYRNTFYVAAGKWTISVSGASSDAYVVISGSGNNGFAYKQFSEGSFTGTVTDATKPFNYILIRVPAGRTVDTTIYVQLETGQTAHAWTPYANICPISGRTGLSVYVGPTNAVGDAATYSMDWTSPAGTVYAGSADIVTGYIKSAPYYASYNGETLVGPWVSSMDAYDPEGVPTTGAQVVDLGGTMTEYHITGQDIITLVGDNYIWSDSGDVTITE